MAIQYEHKLEIAFAGKNPDDPISQLAFYIRKIGLLIPEATIRQRFGRRHLVIEALSTQELWKLSDQLRSWWKNLSDVDKEKFSSLPQERLTAEIAEIIRSMFSQQYPNLDENEISELAQLHVQHKLLQFRSGPNTRNMINAHLKIPGTNRKRIILLPASKLDILRKSIGDRKFVRYLYNLPDGQHDLYGVGIVLIKTADYHDDESIKSEIDTIASSGYPHL
jgi:hypothetical protein